jgi:hypothetical protein
LFLRTLDRTNKNVIQFHDYIHLYYMRLEDANRIHSYLDVFEIYLKRWYLFWNLNHIYSAQIYVMLKYGEYSVAFVH